MLHYRPAITSDLHKIARLHVEISQETYSEILPADYLQNVLPPEKQNLWQRRLAGNSSDHVIFVACRGEEVAGFCCFVFNEETPLGTYLHNLYISSSFQRQGVARSLLRETIATFDYSRKAQPVHLLVFSKNTKAAAVYDRLGGHVVEKVEVARGGNPSVELLRYQWPSAIELSANANR